MTLQKKIACLLSLMCLPLSSQAGDIYNVPRPINMSVTTTSSASSTSSPSNIVIGPNNQVSSKKIKPSSATDFFSNLPTCAKPMKTTNSNIGTITVYGMEKDNCHFTIVSDQLTLDCVVPFLEMINLFNGIDTSNQNSTSGTEGPPDKGYIYASAFIDALNDKFAPYCQETTPQLPSTNPLTPTPENQLPAGTATPTTPTNNEPAAQSSTATTDSNANTTNTSDTTTNDASTDNSTVINANTTPPPKRINHFWTTP